MVSEQKKRGWYSTSLFAATIITGRFGCWFVSAGGNDFEVQVAC